MVATHLVRYVTIKGAGLQEPEEDADMKRGRRCTGRKDLPG